MKEKQENKTDKDASRARVEADTTDESVQRE